jgi:hypothetical protein
VTASGLGETSYILEKVVDTVTPIFMPGHNGDARWIEGFSFSGNIYLDGSPIGTVSGEARLWNPPMILTEVYDQASVRMTNNIDGLGTFEVHAQGVSLSSSTSAASGDTVLSWAGSVANGTGYFDDFYGLAAGTGLMNLFTQTASVTEIVTLRAGF